MIERKFPASWLKIKFTEVLDVQGGTQPPKSQFISEPRKGYIRLLQIRDFGKKPVPTFIPDTIKLKKCGKSDILIGRYGASLGRICTGMSGAYNVALAKVLNTKSLEIKYIKYYLISELFQQPLRLLSRSAQNGFNKDDLAGFDFTLSPLAEQKQIAMKLDDLLTQVDTIKFRLDAIPDILKRFRQSVLAAAVSGKLTEELRGSDAYINHSLSDEWKWPGVPTSWKVKLYPELVDSRLGKMLDKAKNIGLPTRYLGNINVRWFDFDLGNIQEILISKKEQVELNVRVGDVLICEGGEPGRCAIWRTKLDNPIVFQKALHRARVSDDILSEWLVYNLKSDSNTRLLEQLFTGTTIRHLTGKALKKYPLRVPPIEEQAEIVRRVEQLFTFAGQIEQRVKNAQVRVNNLTQSILAKAFRGELTAEWREQNPDLISGEKSAEALLERIKAERNTQSAKKQRRNAKA